MLDSAPLMYPCCCLSIAWLLAVLKRENRQRAFSLCLRIETATGNRQRILSMPAVCSLLLPFSLTNSTSLSFNFYVYANSGAQAKVNERFSREKKLRQRGRGLPSGSKGLYTFSNDRKTVYPVILYSFGVMPTIFLNILLK